MNVGVNCVDRMFHVGFIDSSPWILDSNLTGTQIARPPQGRDSRVWFGPNNNNKRKKEKQNKNKNSIVPHAQPSRRSPSSLPDPSFPSPAAALPPPSTPSSSPFHSCFPTPLAQGHIFSTIFSQIKKLFFLTYMDDDFSSIIFTSYILYLCYR